jgi:expansin (peptidoglycan-binding protein)
MLSLVIFALAVSSWSANAGTEITCPPEFSETDVTATYLESLSPNACLLPVSEVMVTALNGTQWEAGIHCGECLEVVGPEGTVIVKIVDQCPDCPSGSLDLHQEVFNAIGGSPGAGTIPVSWRRVACPVSGNLQFSFSNSSAFYLQIQVLNHAYGIESMDLLVDGAFEPMTRLAATSFFELAPSSQVTDVEVKVKSTTQEELTQSLGPIASNGVIIEGYDQFTNCTPLIFKDGFEQVPE